MELFNTLWIDLLNVLIVLLFLKYGFGLKFPLSYSRLSLYALAYFLWDLLIESKGGTLAKSLGFYIFMFAVLFATLPKKSWKSGFFLIPATLTYLQLNTTVELFARYLGIDKITVPALDTSLDPPVMLAVVLADIFLLFLLFYLKHQVERGIFYFEITPWEGVFLTLLGFSFPFSHIVYTYLEQEYPPRTRLFWLSFCIGANITVLIYFYWKQKINFYRSVSETYRDYYNEEYARFLDYKESQAEMDRFRHDMDNHFLVMQEMLSAKEYEKASRYIGQLLNNRELSYYPVLTGNELLDMLIKMKYPKINSLNISLTVSGNFHVISYMEPMDICIIFSNALDNAIEACEKISDNPYIFLGIKEFSCRTMVLMKNPVPEELREKNLFLKTRKEDKEKHGLGIENMKTALGKYQGTLEYERQGKECIARILLPNRPSH